MLWPIRFSFSRAATASFECLNTDILDLGSYNSIDCLTSGYAKAGTCIETAFRARVGPVDLLPIVTFMWSGV